MLLCVLLLFAALIPVTAYAGNYTVSTYTNYNYFVTFGSNGTWKGIKTPNHNIVETGAVAYCLQPAKDTPSNSGYTDGMGWSAYDETTKLGIQAILENGYPNYNGGFPDGEARYATANAIRFWVAERGCEGALDWMDLTRFSQFFRGASGYEDLYDWCMYLLNCARTGSVVEHNAWMTEPTVTDYGECFDVTTTVTLENCNWGYSIDESLLPSGTDIYGYSGNTGDNLTLRIPADQAGTSFDISITAYDNRSPASVVYTKEVILSGGIHHVFNGQIEVEITREANVYLDFEADGGFETARIISGDLKEVEFTDYDEEAEYGELGPCPKCGRPLTYENSMGAFCNICYLEE